MNHPLELFQFCPRCGCKDFHPATEKSKKCPSCGFEYFLNPSSSNVAIITDPDGRVLVARRAKEPARGTLDLPGGFCDLYESIEEGLRREVREETGLEVQEAQYLFSLPNQYPYSGFTVHTIDAFFLCKVCAPVRITPMDDVGELFWLRPEEIDPSAFGLKSISQGIRCWLETKKSQKKT